MSIKSIVARLSVLVFMFLTLAHAPASAQERPGDPETLFWINVRITKSVARSTGLDEFQLRLLTPTVYHGSAKKFQKELWKGTVQGSKLAVGPFQTYDEAKSAMMIYKEARSAAFSPKSEKRGYWFLVKMSILERSHSYQLEHMAAQVAGGTHKEFWDVLRESLSFMTIAIGPFDSDIQAERAKSIYRIEE